MKKFVDFVIEKLKIDKNLKEQNDIIDVVLNDFLIWFATEDDARPPINIWDIEFSECYLTPYQIGDEHYENDDFEDEELSNKLRDMFVEHLKDKIQIEVSKSSLGKHNGEDIYDYSFEIEDYKFNLTRAGLYQE